MPKAIAARHWSTAEGRGSSFFMLSDTSMSTPTGRVRAPLSSRDPDGTHEQERNDEHE